MKSLKKIGLLALTLAACATGAQAQDKIEANVAADVVSQYIWRGQECGQVSLQPTLGLSWKGLSLTAWGSVGLSNGKTPRSSTSPGLSDRRFPHRRDRLLFQHRGRTLLPLRCPQDSPYISRLT